MSIDSVLLYSKYRIRVGKIPAVPASYGKKTIEHLIVTI